MPQQVRGAIARSTGTPDELTDIHRSTDSREART